MGTVFATIKSFWKAMLAFVFACILACAASAVPPEAGYADDDAGNVAVKIVSYYRGETSDLRSSELLVAQVEGYSGDTSQLSFTWENTSLGTRLYAYGSPDMAKVQDTKLEQVIEPKWGTGSNPNAFTGKGFQWAAVYGADVGSHDLEGKITVYVKDASGKVVGQASYERFQKPSLKDDMNMVAFGVFEGESLEVKSMVGQAGIPHIACPACTVTTSTPKDKKIATTRYDQASNTTHIVGVKEGSTSVKTVVSKGMCKFHANQSATVESRLTVFAKPSILFATSTQIYMDTMTLRDGYDYSIDGQHWVSGKNAATFSDLTPNTDYDIRIRAPYKASSGVTVYSYASIPAKTKEAKGSEVVVALDNKPTDVRYFMIDAKVTAYPTEGDDKGVPVRADYEDEYYLFKGLSPERTYDVYVENGENNQKVKLNDSPLKGGFSFMSEFFSVTYKVDDLVVDFDAAKRGSTVAVSQDDPSREGRTFQGWAYDGRLLHKGDEVQKDVMAPIVLTAKFNDRDVYFNFLIDHTYTNAGFEEIDDSDNKLDLSFTFSYGSSKCSKVLGKLAHNGFQLTEGAMSSEYSADQAVLSQVSDEDLKSAKLQVAKAHYSLVDVQMDSSGQRVTYTATLKYAPSVDKLNFGVKIDQSLMGLQAQDRPSSVSVRALKHQPDGTWVAFTNLISVAIDSATGEGRGSCPIVIQDEELGTSFYRVQVESMIVGSRNLVVFDDDQDNLYEKYVSTDGKYAGTVSVANGGYPVDGSGHREKHAGAYFKKNKKGAHVQQGAIQATISRAMYSVTLDPLQQGAIQDMKKGEKKVYSGLYTMPDISDDWPETGSSEVFSHWEAFDSAGNKVDVPKTGDALTCNLTLKAVYNPPLTLEGKAYVKQTYLDDQGKEHLVPADYLPDSVQVALYLRVKGGDVMLVDAQDADVYKDLDTGLMCADYSFEDFSDYRDNGTYYVSVVANNFEAIYENGSDAKYRPTNWNLYGGKYDEALFYDEQSCKVNALLSVNPDTFTVTFQAEAKSIAKRFLPTDIFMVLTYENAKGEWVTIPQHIDVDGTEYPQKLDFGGDGLSLTGEEQVAIRNTAGTPYEYNAKVVKYIDYQGVERSLPQATFQVQYGNPVHYSDNGKPAELMVQLQPEDFLITFDMGEIDPANVTGMPDNYKLPWGGYGKLHYWSHDTYFNDAVPECPGRKFEGWYYDQAFTQPAGDHIPADYERDVTLYAKWAHDNCVVTFDRNGYGAPTPAPVSVPYGTPVAKPEDMQSSRHDFLGWSTSMDGSDGLYDFSTPVKTSFTLYAQWKIKSFKVSFDTRGGKPDIPTQTVTYGHLIEKPGPITRQGYDFVAWYDEDGHLWDFGSSEVAEDLCLLARWCYASDTPYTIKYFAQKGDGAEYSQVCTVSAKGTTRQLVTADELILTGFSLNEEKSKREGRIESDGSLVLEMYYDRNSYMVSYSYNNTPGGAPPVPQAQSFMYGQPVQLASLPTMQGWSFPEWFSAEADIQGGSFSMPARDVTISGTWIPAEYIVTWKNYDGSVLFVDDHAPYGLHPAYGGPVPSKPSDGEYDYVFAGWTPAIADVTGDATYTATFNAVLKHFTVSFDTDGGLPLVQAQQVAANGLVQEPGIVKKTGYAFAGWFTTGQNPALWNFAASKVMGDTALKAHWTPNTDTKYVVEHYVQDLPSSAAGKTYSLAKTIKATGTTGQTVSAQALSLEGFTFNASVPGTIRTGTIKPDGSLVLKLYYDRNSYTVSYKYKNAVDGAPDLPATASYKYGQRVSVAANPKMEGYGFSGWTCDAVDISAGSFDMPAANIVLIGSWQKQQRLVTFDGNGHGGLAPQPSSVEYGQPVAKPADMVDEHWTFIGWSTSKDGSVGLYDFATPVTSNFVLYAQWKRNVYTVTFDTDGGVPAVPSQSVEYGGLAAKPGVISKAGYTFVGWRADGPNPGLWDFDHSAVTGNMVLRAIWLLTPVTPVQYATEYYIQNDQGTGYSLLHTLTSFGEDGQKVSAEPMILTGFHCNLSAPGTVTQGTLQKGATLVLKLYYDRSSYTVTYGYYNTPDGCDPVPAKADFKYGQQVSVRKIPAKLPGWTFYGWYTVDADVAGDDTFVMPAWDVDLMGLWVPDEYTITWNNYDGKTLFVDDQAPYGIDPCYPGDMPTKPADRSFTYVFNGWTPKLAPVTADATYTAQFKGVPVKPDPVYYTVTFDVQGHGTAPALQTVKAGARAVEPAEPVADGFVFDGWYADQACTAAYDFDAPVTSNVTLYAKWVKKNTPPSPGPDPKRPTKTGDALPLAALAFAVVAAITALAANRYRKKA